MKDIALEYRGSVGLANFVFDDLALWDEGLLECVAGFLRKKRAAALNCFASHGTIRSGRFGGGGATAQLPAGAPGGENSAFNLLGSPLRGNGSRLLRGDREFTGQMIRRHRLGHDNIFIRPMLDGYFFPLCLDDQVPVYIRDLLQARGISCTVRALDGVCVHYPIQHELAAGVPSVHLRFGCIPGGRLTDSLVGVPRKMILALSILLDNI